MLRAATLAAMLLACCVLAVAMQGCSKSDPTNPTSNLPPETILSFSPDAGDTVNWRVRMNWFGWDPDGEVTHFLTMWDSLGWVYTVSTDSVFVVSTEDTAATSEEAFGFHTFSVKAVDDDDGEDPTPASVSFTAHNVFPDTEILYGPSSIADGPFVRFEWQGSDSDGSVVGYGYRMQLMQGGVYVEQASADSISASQTSADFGPLCGYCKFEVWAIDDHGARDATPEMREFTTWCWGPSSFVVTSNIFGSSHWTVYPGALGRPATPIFDGEHVVFDWSAEGQGLRFRHAFDDTSSWSPWSPTDTHFEVTPGLGEHEMHIAVRETLGDAIHVHMRFEVVEAALDDYILVVDDYTHMETYPDHWGTDAERDMFYDAIVAPFGERYEWDPHEHEVHGTPQPPDMATLSGASTVIWYCDYSDAVIGDMFVSYRAYDALGGYVRVGGNLVLCGWKALSQVAGEAYPFDLDPDDETIGKRFIRDVLRIGRVDNSGEGANPNVPWSYGYCFHGALPTVDGDALGFEPAYIDTGQCPDDPGKWFVFCDPPAPQYDRCGLNVESVYPYDGAALELLTVDSFINPYVDGETCAVLYLSGTDQGNVCYLGFPVYYLQTPHAEALLRRVLTLFGEEER